MASSTLNKIQKVMKCFICGIQKPQQFLILRCDHLICSVCLEQIYQKIEPYRRLKNKSKSLVTAIARCPCGIVSYFDQSLLLSQQVFIYEDNQQRQNQISQNNTKFEGMINHLSKKRRISDNQELFQDNLLRDFNLADTKCQTNACLQERSFQIQKRIEKNLQEPRKTTLISSIYNISPIQNPNQMKNSKRCFEKSTDKRLKHQRSESIQSLKSKPKISHNSSQKKYDVIGKITNINNFDAKKFRQKHQNQMKIEKKKNVKKYYPFHTQQGQPLQNKFNQQNIQSFLLQNHNQQFICDSKNNKQRSLIINRNGNKQNENPNFSNGMINNRPSNFSNKNLSNNHLKNILNDPFVQSQNISNKDIKEQVNEIDQQLSDIQQKKNSKIKVDSLNTCNIKLSKQIKNQIKFLQIRHQKSIQELKINFQRMVQYLHKSFQQNLQEFKEAAFYQTLIQQKKVNASHIMKLSKKFKKIYEQDIQSKIESLSSFIYQIVTCKQSKKIYQINLNDNYNRKSYNYFNKEDNMVTKEKQNYEMDIIKLKNNNKIAEKKRSLCKHHREKVINSYNHFIDDLYLNKKLCKKGISKRVQTLINQY